MSNRVHPNLAGWWRFEGNALDSSGHGHDGTLQNSPAVVTGKIGRCLSFAGDFTSAIGTGQRVDLGSPAGLQINSELKGVTLSAWVNLASYPSASNHFGGIVGAGYLAAATGFGLLVSQTKWGFQTRINSTLSSAEVDHNSVSGWVHLCGVRSGGVTRLYVNGVSVATVTTSLSDTSPNQEWAIGQRMSSGVGGFGVNGAIDDVMVFNAGLPAHEIRRVMLGLMPIGRY